MPPAGLKLLYPVKSTFPITQRFGENPQWYPITNGHNGIDWGIPLRTPIYATLPGSVVRVAADNTGYGNHIRISHDGNLLSIYGHMDERNYALVKVGDAVAGFQVGSVRPLGRQQPSQVPYRRRSQSGTRTTTATSSGRSEACGARRGSPSSTSFTSRSPSRT